MAIRITRVSSWFMGKAGLGLKTLAREYIEGFEKVSLMENNIEILPDFPNCTNLSKLLLQQNPLMIIPISFFTKMHIKLSGTRFEPLPDSVSNKWNLHSLLSCFCELKNCYSQGAGKPINVQ